MKKISFVIAVYNNQQSILPTYKRIKSFFPGILSAFKYEIIFIDDGSQDSSLQEILSARKKDKNIKVITFTRNFGQLAAMTAGFRAASGDAVINISADLQDPTDLIPKMIEKWTDGAEIVICYREDRKDRWVDKFYSRIAYGFIRLSYPKMPKGGFDFVLMDNKVIQTYNSIDIKHRFFQGDLLWTGFKAVFIPYIRLERKFGKSQYNFSKKLKSFLDAILDSSYLPIRFISLVGLVFFIAGIIYTIKIILGWINNETPFNGWAPIMIVNLLMGGMSMLMLGILGEYIWRINEEVRKKPDYIIRDRFF